MDFDKLHELSCSVSTYTEFALEHSVKTSFLALKLEGNHRPYLKDWFNQQYDFLERNIENVNQRFKSLKEFLEENKEFFYDM